MEPEFVEKMWQAFKNGNGASEPSSTNGHSKTHPPVPRETAQRGLVRRDSIPGALSPKVTQALAQSIEREALGKVLSLSKEEAQRKLQALVDRDTGFESIRLKLELEGLRVQCLIDNLEYAKHLEAEYPEIEANIWESFNNTDQFIGQVARLIPVANLRRYFDLGEDHARYRDP